MSLQASNPADFASVNQPRGAGGSRTIEEEAFEHGDAVLARIRNYNER